MIFGNIKRSVCPLCNGKNANEEWKIPFSKIDKISISKVGVDVYPMLNSKEVYVFYKCNDCESIYLYQLEDDEGHSDNATHYIKKMKNRESWNGYINRYNYFKKFINKDSRVFLDAACSVGQYATLAKCDKALNLSRVVCLEFCKNYVKYMKDKGFNAHKINLNSEEVSKFVKESSVDFIVFSEAFEHMFDSLNVMRKLVKTLKPKGRIFFSAQALNGSLPIRPGETLYITEGGVNILSELLGCKVVDLNKRHDRFFVTLEKIGKS